MSRSPRLLTHLALEVFHRPEATLVQGLVYLLQTHPALIRPFSLCAFHEMSERVACVQAEKAAEIGRPDMTATDKDGERVFYVEAKLGATPTAHQEDGYPGPVFWIVPARRVREFESLVTRQRRGEPASNVSSWSDVFSALERAAASFADSGALEDLAQLRALAQEVDRVGFSPFTAAELDPRSGNVIESLLGIVDDVVRGVVDDDDGLQLGTRISAQTHAGCRATRGDAVFDVTVCWWRWARDGDSPLWVYPYRSDHSASDAWLWSDRWPRSVRERIPPRRGASVWPAVPLIVRPDAAREALVTSLQCELAALIRAIGSAA